MPPRISHHRRGTTRGNRRGGGGGRVATAAYTLASDPLTLLWWDPTAVSGAVSAWVDEIAGVSAAQVMAALQPTQSNTAIGGAYPGVTSDGGDILVAAGAGPVLSGRTTLTVTAAMADAVSGASVLIPLEYTADAGATNGGFGVFANWTVANAVWGVARGTAGSTSRYAVETLATVKVVSVGYDFATAGAGAVSFVRINGAAQALTTSASASAAGSAASASLHLFARAGVVVPWAGTFGDIAFRNSVTQDAALLAAERFIGARVGLSF